MAPSGAGAMFYHDFPIEYVSCILVPRNLWEHYSGQERVAIMHEIEHAVYNGSREAHSWPGYDWNSARQRVEAVLARHGTSLPGPDDLTWYEHEEQQMPSRSAFGSWNII